MEKFRARAGAYFLCCSDDSELSIEEQLKLLDEKEDNIIPDGVVVWDVIDWASKRSLLNLIETLAQEFEEVYNLKDKENEKK